MADGGTIFLDELAELPLSLQPRLLRVLETGQVKRLGENDMRKVDVRVISASQRDMAHEIAEGNFRQDLYYRLVVAQVWLPPLRDRREDIPVLAQHFIGLLSGNQGARLSAEALEQLVRHDWPGNVMELRNVLQCALVIPPGLSSGQSPDGLLGSQSDKQGTAPFQLRLQSPLIWSSKDERGPAQRAPSSAEPLRIHLEIPPNVPFREARSRVKHALESAYLSRLWAHSGGNISKAARASGIDRKSLREMLVRHGMI